MPREGVGMVSASLPLDVERTEGLEMKAVPPPMRDTSQPTLSATGFRPSAQLWKTRHREPGGGM